jgi:hypothetical protein
MVEDNTVLPDSMRVGEELFSRRWRIVNDLQSYGLDIAMHRIGWSFVYAAPSVNVWGLGFGLQRAVRAAFTRILGKTGNVQFNCLEIRELVARKFLGLTRVTVAAHPGKIYPRR